MRTGVFLLLLVGAVTAWAEEARFRTFAGGFSTRWKTVGPHGHDQKHPCQEIRRTEFPWGYSIGPGDCDGIDFVRGNLDNSIGYRAGIERDFARVGMLRVVGSADTSAAYTEYNLTQNDFFLIGGAVSGGLDVARWGGRLGVRYGGGTFLSTDARYGLQTFAEIVATVPLRSGASLRIARRMVEKTHSFDPETRALRTLAEPVKVNETSVMFVASPDVRETNWEFSTSVGTTAAGGIGSDFNLGTARWHRLTAARALPWYGLEASLTWTTTAHESNAQTDYRGFPGNERSKTVDSYGVAVRRAQQLGSSFSLHYGAGVEVADWRDEHHLLLDPRGNDVIGGVETGVMAGGAVRMRLAHGMALEANLEQTYWTRIGLGERRWGIGLVLTR